MKKIDEREAKRVSNTDEMIDMLVKIAETINDIIDEITKKKEKSKGFLFGED